jgi:hypothetical protein
MRGRARLPCVLRRAVRSYGAHSEHWRYDETHGLILCHDNQAALCRDQSRLVTQMAFVPDAREQSAAARL